MIGKWGANGAALATVGSELLVTITQLIMIRKTISRRKIFKEQWKYIISGMVMFLVVNRICQSINMTIGNLILEVVTGIVIYFVGLLLTKSTIIKQGLEIIRK